jgi:crossover junction endodeoxyribonuclease RuvC
MLRTAMGPNPAIAVHQRESKICMIMASSLAAGKRRAPLGERRDDPPHQALRPDNRMLTAIEPRILGIDPGVTGGIALLHGADLQVWEIPTIDNEVNPQAVARIVRDAAPDMAVVERASSRPGQGVASVFRFGRSYGCLLAVVALEEVPHHLVTPAAWKRAYRLDADKEASRGLAARTWPAHSHLFRAKSKHGLAEAGLIALYGRDFLWRRRP